MIPTLLLIIFSLPYCLTEVWNIYVYTGNERFSGTDASVYIRLFNSQGESTSEHKLTHYNWVAENNDFPIRNLFEMGARERFRIQTEYIGSVAKIQIRHNNFPPLHADWLLDQVIVERIRDGAKYTFKCDCWLRKEHPYITLSVLPDPSTIDKNKTKNSSSKTNRAFVIILITLIILMIGVFCGYNAYRRRRRRHPPLSLNNTVEQVQGESSLLDPCYPQSSRPPSPSSGPHFWMNTLRQWKNCPHGLSSYNHTHTAPSTTAAASTTLIRSSTDQPPAYEDLYPNATAPINTSVNSNS